MSKRKQTEVDEDASDEPTPELVDVNFDYYDVKASNDYHAIKRLLMQLFGADAERVETSALTEVVVRAAEESGVGSTIKTEEEEDSDPYAVLTVISCRDHPGVKPVIDYVLSKTDGEALCEALARAEHVGLVVSERLINMPVQVMAPMYRMLADEIDRAGPAYRFTDYLFVSRAYRLEEDAPVQRDSKRFRGDGLFAFHPEDDEITLHATHSATYPQGEGVGIAGRAMLVPSDKFAAVVGAIGSTYAAT